jgi:hypothetical protein
MISVGQVLQEARAHGLIQFGIRTSGDFINDRRKTLPHVSLNAPLSHEAGEREEDCMKTPLE